MIPLDQILFAVRKDLVSNIQEFRCRAENRIMDNSLWDEEHRKKLKKISKKLFDLQVEINDMNIGEN